jgi:hypothetical protein
MREIPQLLEGVRDLLQATTTASSSDEGKDVDELEVTRLLQLLTLAPARCRPKFSPQ